MLSIIFVFRIFVDMKDERSFSFLFHLHYYWEEKGVTVLCEVFMLLLFFSLVFLFVSLYSRKSASASNGNCKRRPNRLYFQDSLPLWRARGEAFVSLSVLLQATKRKMRRGMNKRGRNERKKKAGENSLTRTTLGISIGTFWKWHQRRACIEEGGQCTLLAGRWTQSKVSDAAQRRTLIGQRRP